jgi:transcriptional regulator NrdR family protein
MSCPKCGSALVPCRQNWDADGLIKRRRECDACGTQFITCEILVDEYEHLKSLEPAEPLEKPCDRCTVAGGPAACTQRECLRWRAWWLQQWEKTRELFPDSMFGGSHE